MSDQTSDEPEIRAGDEPDVFDEYEWGGDGSDQMEPVRDHIRAALLPTEEPYQPPVAELLALGDAREAPVQERRKAIGIGQEHVAELVRMARDRGLHTSDDDDPAGWAPIHAGVLLHDLDVSDFVEQLIPLFDIENDWFSSALPKAIGKVGEPVIAPLRAYLADKSRWVFGHTVALDALEEAAKSHPELREPVVAALSAVLDDVEGYHEYVLSGAMSGLVELKAVGALPLIRRAFELDKIDEMVRGDWAMILKELEVEPEPGDPLIARSQKRHVSRREEIFPPDLQAQLDALTAARGPQPAPSSDAKRRQQEQARKAKNKRKTASAARKANRKKRK